MKIDKNAIAVENEIIETTEKLARTTDIEDGVEASANRILQLLPKIDKEALKEQIRQFVWIWDDLTTSDFQGIVELYVGDLAKGA